MLDAAEINAVTAELEMLVAQAEYRQRVNSIFGPDGVEILKRMKVSYGAPVDCASDIVLLCVELHWDKTPSLLQRLLEHLVNSCGAVSMQPLLQKVASGVDPRRALYDRQWILGDMPFFDRKDLRDHVRELVDRAARTVLRVNGSDGFGRSYTKSFLNFLAQERGDLLRVASARLEKHQAPTYRVDELAAELVSHMGVADVPPPRGSSYPAALKRFVLAEALNRPGRWLFVLEGFDQKDVHTDVRDFIQLLAEAVCDGETRKRARLVLIDYKTQIPNVVPGDILEEVLPPPSALRESDIVKCLEALDDLRRALGRTPWDRTGLAVVAAGILSDAPVEGKDRLESLHQSLLKLKDVA